MKGPDKDPDLWQRLTEHDFPLDDQGKTLLSHLVKETTLGADKAAIALREYRKFLYLAAVSGEIVAPSPLIDRIWHTHIEHTRAYFDDFCPRIIGRVIHHAPGRATAETDPAYARTLALYEAAFGVKPFFRVWPQPKVLRRERLFGRLVRFAIVGLLLWCVIFAATIIRSGSTTAIMVLAVTLLFFPVATVFVAARSHSRFGHWTVKRKNDRSGCGGGGGCSAGDGGGCGGGGD
jgi:hypothetical protein